MIFTNHIPVLNFVLSIYSYKKVKRSIADPDRNKDHQLNVNL